MTEVETVAMMRENEKSLSEKLLQAVNEDFLARQVGIRVSIAEVLDAVHDLNLASENGKIRGENVPRLLSRIMRERDGGTESCKGFCFYAVLKNIVDRNRGILVGD